jgi:hypothetical protein
MTTKWVSRTSYAERSGAPFLSSTPLKRTICVGVVGLAPAAPGPLRGPLAHPAKVRPSASPPQPRRKQDVEAEGRRPGFGLYGDHFLALSLRDKYDPDQFFQRRGWEPDAVLNWLALAGWGTHTEESSDQASKRAAKAPDSTTVMSLSEIVTNVRFPNYFYGGRWPPPDESARSLGWTCSPTGARYWILLNWSTSTSTISCALGRPNLAFVCWLCVVKNTSRTRFLIRQCANFHTLGV